MASQSVAHTSATIQYQRIRVPREDGATLQIPSLNELDALWQANLSRVDASGRSWQVRRDFARREAIEVAFRYSSQYLPKDVLTRLRTRQQVIMSGHQPELFHPGVWFKNFVLNAASKQLNAIPINLIVDSDLSTRQNIAVPTTVAIETKTGRVEKLQYGSVSFDRPTPQQPYEMKAIADGEVFREFPHQVVAAVKAYHGTDSPLVVPIWRHASRLLEANQLGDGPSSGHLIAAARHLLEADFGLETLEVPLSQLCQTESFANFASMIFDEAPTFRTLYNDVLLEYRQVHGIRSRSHPVPELEIAGDGWCEVPFWIWSQTSKRRRPLFVKRSEDHRDDGQIVLSDLEGLTATVTTSGGPPWLVGLEKEGICVRPRALATTLFCRSLLSDLFLHGVGGAKYDQLTDAIAARFWGIELPRYMTLSASFHLPSDRPRTTKAEVTALRVERREMDYHPEAFFQPPYRPEVEALISRKRHWLEGENEAVRSKEKHDAITTINKALRALLPTSEAVLKEQELEARSQLRESEIVTSREFSFVLFDQRLVESLKHAAADELTTKS